jgi:allantoicase
MKAKLLAAALLLAAPANATTYTYESGLYTYNINAHPELFGDRLRGTVTFAEDTSHYTGYGYLLTTIAISLTSGIYTASGPWVDRQFTFNDGEITGWYVGDVVGPCGFLPAGCVIETGFHLNGIYHQCHSCAAAGLHETALGSRGGWTMVVPAQVPGPVVGAGLPGLMMLIAWLMARRRCARSC